jgi:hypothetical protein
VPLTHPEEISKVLLSYVREKKIALEAGSGNVAVEAREAVAGAKDG